MPIVRWTQGHQVPASVLHAETLAAGVRAVPVPSPVPVADAHTAPAPMGGAAEDHYKEGVANGVWSAEDEKSPKDWVTSSLDLAPALDFLLICYRGQAR